jgi:hypothetical protein
VRGRRGLLLLAVLILLPAPPASSQPERQVLLFLLPDVSYQEALGDPVLSALARSGGIALMTNAARPGPESYEALGAGATRGSEGSLGEALRDAGLRTAFLSREEEDPARAVIADASGAVSFEDDFRAAGFPFDPREDAQVLVFGPGMEADIEAELGQVQAGEVLVLAVVPFATAEMREAGDRVTPLVMARGAPGELLSGDGPLRGLTSDTTLREGVVSNVDVAPTILEYLGVGIPDEVTGSPIRPDGEAPTALHRRYLQYQDIAAPIGLAVLGLALAALVAGLVVLLLASGVPGWLRATLAVGGLAGVALQQALLPASILPSLTYPVAVPTVLAIGGVVTAAGVWLGRRRPVVAVGVVAGAGLALVAVEAALGWPALLTPLLGGSALDGVRFYGLGNSYAGIVLAGAVLVAAFLRPWAGVAFLVAAALFAGLPWIGADLGGGLTLFVVAALWWAVRVRRRFRLPEAVVAVAALGAGLALLVVTHRLFPSATHVTRAVESSGGVAGIFAVFWNRFLLNVRTTAATPAVWLTILGLPVGAAVAWRRPGPFRRPLEAEPAWRDAALVLALGGMIGYVLNDTFGTASVAFVYLSAALVYPALLARWRSD